MVFSSHIFLFYFLPFTLVIYYALILSKVNLSIANLFITVVSYVFYGWLNPWYISLMWVSTILDYTCGRLITRPGASKNLRNGALAASMIGNLALLGFFKYAGFFAESVNQIIALFGFGPEMIPVLRIMLPAGISFYTFQTMSYTIDVWRGDAPPVKDIATFSCFVALYPQLIAGPIVRYQSVAEQLSYRKHSLSMFTSGTSLFLMGLAKKIILADSVAPIADAVFGADAPGVMASWWGIIAYSFQIYFDFSGYSDMAVGLGRMLGFEFIQNFNSPYHAQSITDFWRRWHISLTDWFRNYLYFPLGGNRVSKGRMYFNLVLTFFLSGLWHGNQLHFLMWGIYQGLFLLFERLLGKKTLYQSLPLNLRVVFTFGIVLLGWVLFRAPSMGQAVQYWGSMLGFIKPTDATVLLNANIFSIQSIFSMIVCTIFTFQPFKAHQYTESLSPVKLAVISAVFILTMATMFTQAFSPFLYFQF